jgi:tRNA(fMet)-specific endonuclease VapC
VARIIDTSVCIEIERRGQFDFDLATLSATEPIGITTITAAELLTGTELVRIEALRERSLLVAENLLQRVDLYDFDIGAARIYARLNAYLLKTGLRVGGFDLQIASIAIANQCSVVTLNLREFRRIPDLTVIAPDW